MARKKPEGETLDSQVMMTGEEEEDLFRRANPDWEKDLPAWRKLVEESMEASAGPYRMTNEAIELERVRFDAAQEFIARGKVETARRICWWPKNEDPPKKHWSRVPHAVCSCRRRAADGYLGLCGYCGGTTDATPSAIPVRQIPNV